MLCAAAPAAAQDAPGAWSPDARHIADGVSTGLVFTQIGLDTLASWRAPDRKRAFTHQALRLGGTIGVAELTKLIVHRRRPDGSDYKSFFSEHTAVAAASGGWSLQVTLPITIGAGYLRGAADKHYPSDVGTGAIVGGLFAWFLR